MKLSTIKIISYILITIFANTSLAEDKAQQEMIVAGWLEGVLLQPWNVKMRAKLDTGAETSSLHAVDIERFEREGVEWVKFRTSAHAKDAELLPVEAPLVRDVKIKDHKRKSATRPVVNMTFCFQNQLFTSEFSLVDRSRFNYPVLFGRRMLQQGIIVDPSLTFTFRSDKKVCKKLMTSDQAQLLAE